MPWSCPEITPAAAPADPWDRVLTCRGVRDRRDGHNGARATARRCGQEDEMTEIREARFAREEGARAEANRGTRADEGFERSLGLRTAVAINMTQMCGIGPFVTIPLMIATLGGPQAVFGWILGALLALADGLVWAELGAAMPGAGGTYLYLREAFQYRTGRLMPFLFVWSAVLFIPLIMSTGIIGLVQYLGYLIPGVTDDAGVTPLGKIIGVGLIIAIYDYLGYNTTAYLGGEVSNPGRTIPRSIIFSILGIMSLYFLL